MRCLTLLTKMVVLAVVANLSVVPTATAHHPDRESQPVHPRFDLIGPIGNRLPAGYRRTYNRPSNWGGRIAYKIAPSSQEAMAWHRATHRGDYVCERGPVVPIYEHQKPWQALRIGARPAPNDANDRSTTYQSSTALNLDTDSALDQPLLDDAPEIEPELLDELIDPVPGAMPLIEVDVESLRAP